MSTDAFAGRAMRGTALALAGFATTQVLTFAAYVVLARLLAPHDFGVYAAGVLVSGVAMLFTESGMMAALITRRDRLEEAANTALLSTAASGLGIALVSLAISPLIGLLFDDRRVAAVTAAMSGILVIRALSIVPDALLQRRMSFARRVVVEPLGVVAFAVVAIVACSNGAQEWGLVAGTYASMTVQTASAWAFARWRPRPRRASMEMWRELAGYARHVLASEIVRRIVAQVDVLIIGRLVSLGALGQYRYASRLAMQPNAAWMGVGAYILLPMFSRLSGDRPRLSRGVLRVTRWMAMGTFPASLMLVAIGLPLAVVAFGEEWREAGWAAMALCGFPVGQAMVSLGSEVFKAVGRPQELPRVHLLTGLASIVAMLALLPFGLIGVAAGVSLGSLAGGVYTMGRMASAVALPPAAVARALAAPLACAVAMGAGGYAISAALAPEQQPTLIALLLLAAEVVFLLGAYLALLVAVSPEHRREALGIAQLVRNAIDRRRHGPSADRPVPIGD